MRTSADYYLQNDRNMVRNPSQNQPPLFGYDHDHPRYSADPSLSVTGQLAPGIDFIPRDDATYE